MPILSNDEFTKNLICWAPREASSILSSQEELSQHWLILSKRCTEPVNKSDCLTSMYYYNSQIDFQNNYIPCCINRTLWWTYSWLLSPSRKYHLFFTEQIGKPKVLLDLDPHNFWFIGFSFSFHFTNTLHKQIGLWLIYSWQNT